MENRELGEDNIRVAANRYSGKVEGPSPMSHQEEVNVRPWTQEELDRRNREVLGTVFYTKEIGWTAEGIAEQERRKSKYNARKKELDGHVFDSTAEARRYTQLKEEQRLGLISALELQPRFLLQEGFRDESGKWVRKIEYVADFRYLRGGAEIVEDAKGMATPLFTLKLKLFRAKFRKVRLDVIKGRQR